MDRTSSRTALPGVSEHVRHLALGGVFGVVFGFLLQKGGVAKFHVLIGALLLEDFIVFKVMLSAIAVGMIGVYALHARGLVELHVKPTRWAGNIVGGLCFGAGFALAAYCPGTSAAALGQGNGDALAVILGMIAGSAVFAEVSERANGFAGRWGERGKLTWPALLGLPARLFVPFFAVALLLVLIGLSYLPT